MECSKGIIVCKDQVIEAHSVNEDSVIINIKQNIGLITVTVIRMIKVAIQLGEAFPPILVFYT